MKCFIIAALSADGYIAKGPDHGAFWTSKEDKKRFIELTKRAGVVVMGYNTWKTLPRPLKERVNIVYTKSHDNLEGAEVTRENPVDLLRSLEERGFKEVAICGGSSIYTMFMKANVVDELYITVEPILFGSGMRLFNEEMHIHLKAKNAAQADEGAILIDYIVDHAGTPKAEINP